MKTYEYTPPIDRAAGAAVPVSVPTSLSRERHSELRHIPPATRRGRHRKPQLIRKISSEHGKRLTSFSLIGFGVFAAGLVAQVFLVRVAWRSEGAGLYCSARAVRAGEFPRQLSLDMGGQGCPLLAVMLAIQYQASGRDAPEPLPLSHSHSFWHELLGG